MSAFSQKLDTAMQSPFLKNDTYCAHDSVAENLHDDLIDSITKKFSDDYFCDGDPFGVRRCGTPPSRFASWFLTKSQVRTLQSLWWACC